MTTETTPETLHSALDTESNVSLHYRDNVVSFRKKKPSTTMNKMTSKSHLHRWARYTEQPEKCAVVAISR
ncbi:hypothetical protein I7Z51_002450 [Vibrio parahaemolyticus]|uniref:hypothetical protein n=1 Tax=Vibrio TaxID=662 RepID=UPI001A8DCB9E|nr:MULTISPECIES: hypothetical protein [Vibrio]EGQ7973528.1 hypothetical protein [Vibrio parahaemolyticus]MBO0208570.1 hypothetical protein [Vibrio sp. Vb0877]MCR9810966.1 hypothetical protein [Vibrio parahaemolyticus]MDW2323226.1 hypothetical protein [Vibrio sp. 1159]